jgi:prophage regulatory protein
MSTQNASSTSNLDQIHRPKPLAKRLGVSTTTIWRMRGRHEFPEPVQISPGAIGWRESDVQAWLATRAKGR